jgi:hypothetical protein
MAITTGLGCYRKTPFHAAPRQAATALVDWLLDDALSFETSMDEASVHRSGRGRIWTANFTGPTGGQVWKSTGATNREQALKIAKRWEGDARAQRLRTKQPPSAATVRIRHSQSGTNFPSLTQREVAMLLNLSERGVREIERRAFRKLRAHPALRDVWQQFLAGELGESEVQLSAEEIEALFRLARSTQERQLLRKVLLLVQP